MSGSTAQGIGLTAFRLAFEISPIILSGGIAQYTGGGYLPIVLLTEPLALVQGVIGGAPNIGLDDFFAKWVPMPGATLAENQAGTYPFANQTIAANAIIKQPRYVSMRMLAPAAGPAGYVTKLASMAAITTALDQHDSMGGMYIVATPAHIWFNCIRLKTTDITEGGAQVQTTWQFDFYQPLLALSQAQQTLSAMMNRLNNFSQVTSPSWGGAGNAVGQPLQGAALAQPGMTGLAGGNVQAYSP